MLQVHGYDSLNEPIVYNFISLNDCTLHVYIDTSYDDLVQNNDLVETLITKINSLYMYLSQLKVFSEKWW